MGIDRAIAIISVILGVVGIGAAFYFYRKTIRTKLLAIGYTDSVPSLVVDPSSGFTEILPTKQARSFVLLWNKGSAPIVEADFTRPILVDSPKEVSEISIFDKDVATSVHINKDSREISVKLLRPNEAIILEIMADTQEALSLLVEMVSADMSMQYSRTQRIPDLEPLFAIFGLCLIPIAMFAPIAAIPKSIGLGLGLVFLLLPAVISKKWNRKLQKSVTPKVVLTFYKTKEAATDAQGAITSLQAAFTWLRRAGA